MAAISYQIVTFVWAAATLNFGSFPNWSPLAAVLPLANVSVITGLNLGGFTGFVPGSSFNSITSFVQGQIYTLYVPGGITLPFTLTGASLTGSGTLTDDSLI